MHSHAKHPLSPHLWQELGNALLLASLNNFEHFGVK
uniref:Uncharacterized protein n=1 Tax=Rhizophora mucronata TaxID=61149 RepID=A0A2P2PGA6_RHIMU